MASLLYVRSVYSLLSSMCTIPRMVKKAKEKGYSSIGLVDKNVLSGAMSFYNECLKENIKPVIGLEVGVNVDRIVSVILYAKDDFGNLKMETDSAYASKVMNMMNQFYRG